MLVTLSHNLYPASVIECHWIQKLWITSLTMIFQPQRHATFSQSTTVKSTTAKCNSYFIFQLLINFKYSSYTKIPNTDRVINGLLHDKQMKVLKLRLDTCTCMKPIYSQGLFCWQACNVTIMQIKGTVTHKLFQIILVQSALSWRPLLMSNHFLLATTLLISRFVSQSNTVSKTLS